MSTASAIEVNAVPPATLNAQDSLAAQTQSIETENSSWLWEYASLRATDEDEGFYLQYTLLAMAYWIFLACAIHVICMRFNHRYREDDAKARASYRSYAASPIHALCACFLSAVSMFYICGDDKTVFNDEKCFNTPRHIHIWAMLHSCSYFLVDLYVQRVQCEGTSPLDYQTYAHHIIAVVTF